MRGQGRVFRPKVNGRESQVWWMDYGVNGQRHRESSKTTSKREALNTLRERIGKRKDGTLTGRPDRVTLADLKDGLRKHYAREGNASWTRAEQAFVHLEEFFEPDARVATITRARVRDYQDERLEAGAARNSVRYEVGVLSAALGVAVDQDLLAAKPVFKQPAEGDKRTGFFEEGELAVLVAHLPRDVGDLVRFLRMTGWRRGEGVGLLWSQVDWDDAEYPGTHDEPIPGPNASIRIGEADTKGGDSRTFPIADAPDLCALFVARWNVRNGLRVFHRNGKAIGDFRKTWARACKAAGATGRLVHDLRRTAARDFRRAGVSEGEIMRLCGWKTRDMFDRYNIIDAADLARAVRRRFTETENDLKPNGKETANTAPLAG
jgi:integrase